MVSAVTMRSSSNSHNQTNEQPLFQNEEEGDYGAGSTTMMKGMMSGSENPTQLAELFEDFLQFGTVGLHIVDTRGIVLWANQTELDLLGYTKEEYIGQSIVKFHADPSKIAAILSLLLSDRQVKNVVAPLRCKDGHIEYVEINSSMRKVDGKITTTRCFSACVTDRILKEKAQRKAELLEVEKQASEQLLHNMLPKEIAARLKLDPSHLADHCASVLFADICGFTHRTSKMAPIHVVGFLNDLFSRFDALVEKYQLNKVKTIGDCYMVTSVPVTSSSSSGNTGNNNRGDENIDHSSCAALCHFAFDMLESVKVYNQEYPDQDLPVELRVGVHVGPVVAGVVGTTRFLYDVWGDTVNVASRIESTGQPGRIHVSKDVIALLPSKEFAHESRGKVCLKGKGLMETAFLTKQLGSKPDSL
jgi:adenylate cyclase